MLRPFPICEEDADLVAGEHAPRAATVARLLGDGKTVQLSNADARAALMDEPSLSRLQVNMNFSTKGGLLSILAEAIAAKEHRRHKSNSGVAGCELLGFRCPNGIARHMLNVNSARVVDVRWREGDP